MTPGSEKSAQQLSNAFVLAERDLAFLARPELRPIRLQLELLKPALLMREQGVVSTVVVFGSARVPAPGDVDQALAKAEIVAAGPGEDPNRERRLHAARRLTDYSKWYAEAQKFGALISAACQGGHEADYVVITGGGPGIMEAANRGASDVGAKSIGLNIVLPFEQRPNPYIHPNLCFNFHYFAMRKMHFLMRAKALAFFPGGFGTLDEMFEALTLIQTGKIGRMPCVLFGREFWDKLIDFDFLADEGLISPEDLDLIEFVETAEQGWERIQAFYGNGNGRGNSTGQRRK
ncbi:MAG: LOG family protein [Planctomycetes bacterium]|nr:LOG family protein [Planctomycetota bacterium]